MSDKTIVQRIVSGSLVLQIAVGIVCGVVLSLVSKEAGLSVMLLGNLFVQALKAVAPLLVLVLVASALANQGASHQPNIRPIVVLYLLGTLSAAFVAVLLSTLFPTVLALNVTDIAMQPPQGIGEVLDNLLFKMVDNPVSAIMDGNFIGILVWGFLELTRHGRLMYAIGSNERAATLTGTNVNAYKIVAYMISGVLASVGGMLLAARLGRGDIASGTNLLLDAVAAALIGFAVLGAAKPNAFGTAIGALFVGILLQGLTMMNAPYYTQDFVKGAVLVVALVFTFSLSGRKAGGH